VAEPVTPFVHRGTRAIQRMVEYAPSTGGLALWVGHRNLPAEADAPVVMTDGNTLFYGPAFDALSLADQTGLVAHEVLHIALRHPQRFLALQSLLGDADLQLFTISADAIVNSALSHLSWLRLPKGAVHLDELLRTALNIDAPVGKSLLEWDVERLYRAIDDRQAPNRNARRQTARSQEGAGRNQDDSPVEPPQNCEHPSARRDGPRSSRVRELGARILADLRPDPERQAAPEAEVEDIRLWSERLLRGHTDDGAFSMLRALIADLPKTRTPWEHVLRTLLARSLSRRPELSWSRPSRSYLASQGRSGPYRRKPWEPGVTASKKVPRLAVIADVSGSIEDGLMERFAREIEAMTRRLEAGLVLIVGDDQVRHVEHFEPSRSSLREIRFHGGGGTDFAPLIEEAGRHRPDIAVVLTDLDGPAGPRPRFPVIWAVPERHAQAAQPFGRKIVLD
jgi:predicted metal-dependent peptidase